MRMITFSSFQSDVSDCQSLGLTASGFAIVSCGSERDVDCERRSALNPAACRMPNEEAAPRQGGGDELAGRGEGGRNSLAD